jgi:trehalose 6-phosphate phosphatase
MKHLYTPDGERALAAVMRLEPLLAFDFDGTLAPIVERPDDAKVTKAVANRLSELARHRPLAIITGRSVADVMPRLGFEPHHVIGSHGAEDPHADSGAALIEAMTTLRSRLSAKARELLSAGVMVEDKEHSIALHYRLAPDQDSAMARITEFLQGLDPSLRTFGGKFVVNVVAAEAPDKGDAVRALMLRSGSASAVFIGDDVNDEAVFQIAEPHWLTVRIGEDADSRAMYFLESHAQIASLLRKMLSLLNPP